MRPLNRSAPAIALVMLVAFVALASLGFGGPATNIEHAPKILAVTADAAPELCFRSPVVIALAGSCDLGRQLDSQNCSADLTARIAQSAGKDFTRLAGPRAVRCKSARYVSGTERAPPSERAELLGQVSRS